MLLGNCFGKSDRVRQSTVVDVLGYHISLVREGGALADDCERELVVSLGDERYRVAVPGLELKLASGVCTTATC